MSDVHYGTEARLMELEIERGRRGVQPHHRPVGVSPATTRTARHRVADRLRRAADRLDG